VLLLAPAAPALQGARCCSIDSRHISRLIWCRCTAAVHDGVKQAHCAHLSSVVVCGAVRCKPAAGIALVKQFVALCLQLMRPAILRCWCMPCTMHGNDCGAMLGCLRVSAGCNGIMAAFEARSMPCKQSELLQQLFKKLQNPAYSSIGQRHWHCHLSVPL
jgi:hypothetical protein